MFHDIASMFNAVSDAFERADVEQPEGAQRAKGDSHTTPTPDSPDSATSRAQGATKPELTDEVLRGLLVLRALGLTSPTRDRVPELEAALKYIQELGETT